MPIDVGLRLGPKKTWLWKLPDDDALRAAWHADTFPVPAKIGPHAKREAQQGTVEKGELDVLLDRLIEFESDGTITCYIVDESYTRAGTLSDEDDDD